MQTVILLRVILQIVVAPIPRAPKLQQALDFKTKQFIISNNFFINSNKFDFFVLTLHFHPSWKFDTRREKKLAPLAKVLNPSSLSIRQNKLERLSLFTQRSIIPIERSNVRFCACECECAENNLKVTNTLAQLAIELMPQIHTL